jgi:hypothetical protein
MRKLLFVLSVMALPLTSNAQYNWEYGGGAGAANYLGDMGGKELTRRDFVADMKLKQTRASSNVFVRYKLSPMFSIKSSLNFIILRGADSLSTNVPRNTRNLNFRNRVFELSNECQFFFYEVNDLGRTYRYRNGFRAYIGAGVGVMYHAPQAFYQGDWVALRPLMTEGNKYTRITMSLPVSGGFYFTVAKTHRIGWNLCWRTTFTDYLDDVSTTYADPSVLPSAMAIALANRTYERPNVDPVVGASFAPGEKRGDPTHNDSFLTTNIEYSYVLRGKSSIYKSKYGSLFKGKKYKRRKVRAKF